MLERLNASAGGSPQGPLLRHEPENDSRGASEGRPEPLGEREPAARDPGRPTREGDLRNRIGHGPAACVRRSRTSEASDAHGKRTVFALLRWMARLAKRDSRRNSKSLRRGRFASSRPEPGSPVRKGKLPRLAGAAAGVRRIGPAGPVIMGSRRHNGRRCRRREQAPPRSCPRSPCCRCYRRGARPKLRRPPSR